MSRPPCDDAALLVFPSEWYEGQPRTILESFAVGTPVVAADLGAMGELIRAGHTGVHFQPGDPGDLARVVAGYIRQPDGARTDARADTGGVRGALQRGGELPPTYRHLSGT